MESIFFALHIIGIIISVFGILRADKMGFSWFKGKTQVLNKILIERSHKQVWIGLFLTIVSGVVLFWDKRFYLLNDNPAFLIKMAFVVALSVNGAFIGRLMSVAFTKPFVNLTFKEKAPLFISGAVSTVSWIGAIVAAFFL